MIFLHFERKLRDFLHKRLSRKLVINSTYYHIHSIIITLKRIIYCSNAYLRLSKRNRLLYSDVISYYTKFFFLQKKATLPT